jgi:hypothetical protein
LVDKVKKDEAASKV